MNVLRSAVLQGDLAHALRVPAAFEGRGQEGAHELLRFVDRDEAGGQTQDVRVVVLSRERGDIVAPGDGGADALVFVRRDGDAVGAAADQDALPAGARLHRLGDGMHEVGIVDRIERMRAFVVYGIAFVLQRALDQLFVFESGVVATDGKRRKVHGMHT